MIEFPKSDYFGQKKPENPIIIRSYTKFKIDNKKTLAYLDLHYSHLIITDKVVARCCQILNVLLRYAKEGDMVESDNWEFYSEPCWENYQSRSDMFNRILRGDIKILCCNPNNRNANAKSYFIGSILVGNAKYREFLNYWGMLYSCEDLINALTQVSRKLLRDSQIGNEIPMEVIEKILIIAYYM